MKASTQLLAAAALGVAGIVGSTSYAVAQSGNPTAAQLRATGRVGEQANGYLGVAGEASAELRASVNAINIRRRAAYAELAGRRGVTIEEVAVTMACEIFATAVLPGQYYRLPDGVWRRREGNAPVQRPAYCI